MVGGLKQERKSTDPSSASHLIPEHLNLTGDVMCASGQDHRSTGINFPKPPSAMRPEAKGFQMCEGIQD